MGCCLQLLLAFPPLLIAVGVVAGIIYRRMSGRFISNEKMTGKTVIITGGNSGIGYYAAKDLASRGARVILACRSKVAAEKARASIIEATNNENVLVKLVDLTSFNSIRSFCKDVLETEKRLDVLINNAGDFVPERTETIHGMESTIATNHHGHFLMTVLLLDLLKKSSPSRIINVSSGAHSFHDIDFDDLHFKKRAYSDMRAYSQSKLCNILFTKELCHKLVGTGVTANSLHPGFVATPLAMKHKTVKGSIINFIGSIVAKDSELGAQTTIYLAVSNEVAKTSGEYFVDCKIAESSKKSRDPGVAKKLWEVTEEEVGLTEGEEFYESG